MTNFIKELLASLETTNSLVQDLNNFPNSSLYEYSEFNGSESILPKESYIVDPIIIKQNQLSNIKWNNLSEFLREEVIEYQIVRWNKQFPSVFLDLNLIKPRCFSEINQTPCQTCKLISITNSNITLDKLTFKVSGSDTLYNLKDFWPKNGTDLLIKGDEGLRIRSLLGIDQDQDIKLLSLPSSTRASFQTSIVSDLKSMKTSSLFYRSELSDLSLTTLISEETKPNTSTVQEYHAYIHYINKPLPQEPVNIPLTQEPVNIPLTQEPLNLNKDLPQTPAFPRHFYVNNMGRIRGQIWTHSIIIEDSLESLLLENNNRLSSNNTLLSETSSTQSNIVTYAFPQNNELRNEILGMIERNEINNNSILIPIPTRSNTDDTLVNNTNLIPTRTNTSDTSVENNLNNVIRNIETESLTELTNQNRLSQLSQLSETDSRNLRSSIGSYSNLGLYYNSSIIRNSSESLQTKASSNLLNDLD